MQKGKITPMQIARIQQQELLNVGDACLLTQYRLSISRAHFYNHYRRLIPFQSLNMEVQKQPVLRIRTRSLNILIDFWVENPRFVEQLGPGADSTYMQQYKAQVAEIMDYITEEN